MARFESAALDLATRAVGCLNPEDNGSSITHLVLASCTGFTAPGIDQQLVEALGLDPSVERTALGFMGCAAAVNALKIAHHIVRSTPDAKILVVNIELCTLHMQETRDLEQILSALLFGDGCSAALVSSDPVGLALTDFKAVTIPDTQKLITWAVGDQGFNMTLSVRCRPRLHEPWSTRRAKTTAASSVGHGPRRLICGRCMPAGERSWTQSNRALVSTSTPCTGRAESSASSGTCRQPPLCSYSTE